MFINVILSYRDPSQLPMTMIATIVCFKLYFIVILFVSTCIVYINYISIGHCETFIREYGSTLYVGMAQKNNGRPYISIASDELKSLVIYRKKF